MNTNVFNKEHLHSEQAILNALSQEPKEISVIEAITWSMPDGNNIYFCVDVETDGEQYDSVQERKFVRNVVFPYGYVIDLYGNEYVFSESITESIKEKVKQMVIQHIADDKTKFVCAEYYE